MILEKSTYKMRDGRQESQHDRKLQEILKRLIPAFNPLAIYLFGSKARGDGGSNSDYDLMVVVPDNAAGERRKSKLAYQSLRGTGIAADVLVWTKSSFDRRLPVPTSLPSTIQREGKLLYGG